jgi:carbon monoxide dehydrogenase subunit G
MTYAKRFLPRTLASALLPLALASFATLAVHAAPTPLKTLTETQTVDIAAKPDQVWAIVKNFSDLTWVTPVKKSTATNGNVAGSVRTLDFGGAQMTEELVAYDAGTRQYTYAIQNTPDNQKIAPVSDVKATISVAAAADGHSLVTWKATFHRVDHAANPAEGHDDASAQKTLHGVIEGGLAALKAKAEQH